MKQEIITTRVFMMDGVVYPDPAPGMDATEARQILALGDPRFQNADMEGPVPEVPPGYTHVCEVYKFSKGVGAKGSQARDATRATSEEALAVEAIVDSNPFLLALRSSSLPQGAKKAVPGKPLKGPVYIVPDRTNTLPGLMNALKPTTGKKMLLPPSASLAALI